MQLPNRKTMLCYHASQEQFSPSRLLRLVRLAEQAGFDGIHSSDHFHPWSTSQGQSEFTFSWIAAAMQATKLPFSMVCSPGQRYHPAIVAQAIATLAELFPGRFGIELGSGEALNEAITGTGWPAKNIRNERLQQCAGIIRQLLNGEEVTYSGHVKVEKARLYTLPEEVPLLMGCAISCATASWLGNWSDGLLTTAGELHETLKKVEAFRKNGGADKPVYLQYCFSYGHTIEEATAGAWQQWRSNFLQPDKLADLTTPQAFESATTNITEKDVAEHVPLFTKMDDLMGVIESFERSIHPNRIILHNVHPAQDYFIEEYARYGARWKSHL